MTYAKRFKALMFGLAVAASIPAMAAQEPVVTGRPVEHQLNLQEPVTGIAAYIYSLHNWMMLICLIIFLKLGWLSVVCIFLSYFFMSIMFPTIFALGIFGLGARAKKASAFIVMAIMGGAILPKVMGFVADEFDMSRGFIVPMFCFAFVAFYGFNWPRFSHAESLQGVKATGGH